MAMVSEAIKTALLKAVEFEVQSAANHAWHDIGFREAVASVLRSTRNNGPEATIRNLATAIDEGRLFCPDAREDAKWVLKNIEINQPQEIGL